MEILLLTGLIQLLIAFVYFASRGKKSSADRIVLLFLATVFVHLLFELLRFLFPHSLLFTVMTRLNYMLLYSPFLYLYTIHEVDPQKSFRRVYLYHTLPFFVISAIIIFMMIPGLKSGDVVKVTCRINRHLSIFSWYYPSPRLDMSALFAGRPAPSVCLPSGLMNCSTGLPC